MKSLELSQDASLAGSVCEYGFECVSEGPSDWAVSEVGLQPCVLTCLRRIAASVCIFIIVAAMMMIPTAVAFADDAAESLRDSSTSVIHFNMPVPGTFVEWEMSSGDIAFPVAEVSFAVVTVEGTYASAQAFIRVNIFDNDGTAIASNLTLEEVESFSYDFGESRDACILRASLHVDEAASDSIRSEWLRLRWRFIIQDVPATGSGAGAVSDDASESAWIDETLAWLARTGVSPMIMAGLVAVLAGIAVPVYILRGKYRHRRDSRREVINASPDS
ncbi:hypothetical protein [Bifidobacterium aquikefiri]|uniref:hypothetical protein n=1 Tax=Bifidobacterium aquikefiri TaxID=1653207 RepID=UPI0039E74AF0